MNRQHGNRQHWNYGRRVALRAIVFLSAIPAVRLLGQMPIVVQCDVAADNEAMFAAKNVLCFVRGAKALNGVKVQEVKHNDSGAVRASVVRLRYPHGRSKVVSAVITMEMVKKPGLRRFYRLTYRDDVNPLYFPEQLMQVRERLNTVLAEGDLLTRLTPQPLAFEEIPLLDELPN